MVTFLKRPLYVLTNKIRNFTAPTKNTEEKWTADFSKLENSYFDIKSEISYDAYLETPQSIPDKASPLDFLRRQNGSESGALVLGLKKTNCIAWVDTPSLHFQDQVIEAKFCLDSMGGYAASGLMFRIIEDGTYYLALISGKGYFRLDAVRNNTPLPLIGWTEIPGFESAVKSTELRAAITIIAYGDHLIFLINQHWAAEVQDAMISEGRLGFVLASYEAGQGFQSTVSEPDSRSFRSAEQEAYTCKARLEYLCVDSRINAVENVYNKWNDSRNITAESRLRLAETFAAMGNSEAALFQINKAWENREEAARSVLATFTESRAKKELLLAAQMAVRLGKYDEADEYIDVCIEQGLDSPEGKEALLEKAKILLETEKYEELKSFVVKHIALKNDDPVLHTLLGHAYWYLDDHANAAAAYEKAFEIDSENGTYAVNAGNAYSAMKKKKQALACYLAGGRAFLNHENYDELGELIPQLLSLGKNDREAHALAGKWAFGIEDFEFAETELVLSEKIREKKQPLPPADPAVSFLRGLLSIRKGHRQEAFGFLEEAVRLAPGYGLFHFRLAENRYLYTDDADDSQVSKELEAALELLPDDGWVNNFAAQISLARNDLAAAKQHLEKAARTLGEVPAIRMNRGVLAYLQGSMEEALNILDAEKQDDPQGILANCAGNLLVRKGKYEEADVYYRKAQSYAPDNSEYLSNRATCLIELGYYGQAEELLSQAQSTPEILELISYSAVKRGEYDRAETASLSALDMVPNNIPSLFSLGWIYNTTGRWNDLEKIIARLNKMKLEGNNAQRRDELHQRLDEGMNKVIGCAGCRRKWKIKRKNDPVPPFKLQAMPPDEFPAGTCPACGKTYCIACAKKHIDRNGRFICYKCKVNLKLADEGLKKIIYDWAVKTIPGA